jgi:hypothetical protein
MGLLAIAGCGLADGGGGGALFGSDGFIIRGTMTVVSENGVCPVFQADDGFSYQLRQGTGLSNEEYDAVTEIGAISRLEVTLREDLRTACRVGTVVVVLNVLELIPPDGGTPEPN